ncbi:hypothetical protein I8751_25650 [Nostocaceae cyanobacterium CENA357]|uniref:Uncharacterized protein n=1 Tax=Atlanticothrix silvestris CENA357 TaxID=1725252 RepID=A0A8J7HHJ6_9CYAN|nr:hypothetical protein [Atlanticothrix silvestris CENA357]
MYNLLRPANPVQIIVAQTEQGRGILGVIKHLA